MKSTRLALIGICVCGFVSESFALRFLREYVPRLTLTQQATQAEMIVVGRVVEIEETDAEVPTSQGSPEKIAYKIANIKINENLGGAKGLTHIRVGFLPTNQPIQQPQLQGLEGDWGPRSDSYSINDEGCFFLQKHPSGDFYVQLPNSNRLDAKHQTYEGELGKIKRMIEVFEKPMEALRGKDAEERQFALSTLLHKYKTPPTLSRGVGKEMEVPKEESSLILKTLSEMENNADPSTNFASLFNMLQLTNRDGWVQPNLNNQGGDNNQILKEAFVQWYKVHGEKYQMKKWVPSNSKR